jgi:prefoldin subunit 5
MTNYQNDKKAVVGWGSGIAAALVIACLGFVATQLSAHDTAIAVIKEKQTASDKVQDEMRNDIKELLRRTPKP